MYTDRENIAELNAAVTVTRVSADSIYVGGRNLGRSGQPLRAVVDVDTTFTAAGAATDTIDLIEADDAALTTNVTVLLTTGALALAALTAGSRVMDAAVPATRRNYIGFRHTIATGPMTAGAVTSQIVANSETVPADRPAFWNPGR